MPTVGDTVLVIQSTNVAHTGKVLATSETHSSVRTDCGKTKDLDVENETVTVIEKFPFPKWRVLQSYSLKYYAKRPGSVYVQVYTGGINAPRGGRTGKPQQTC